MYLLEVTHSKLYELVAEYAPLPHISKTEFKQIVRNHVLEWLTWGKKCKAHLIFSSLGISLSIKSKGSDIINVNFTIEEALNRQLISLKYMEQEAS